MPLTKIENEQIRERMRQWTVSAKELDGIKAAELRALTEEQSAAVSMHLLGPGKVCGFLPSG